MTEQTQQQQHPENEPGTRFPVIIVAFAAAGMVMAALVLLAGSGGQAQQVPEGTVATRQARVSSGQNTVVGWEVPAFDVITLEGEEVNITDYRGKVVFLNFWATWCEPCQREMPAFESFMASGREDAIILAVNHGETAGDVQGFVDLFGLEHIQFLMDEDFEISDGFGVVNLPVTYVLNEDGVVRGFKLGEITEADMDAYIEQIEQETAS
ncbi:MAG: redoxin domain-containing protein [Chloroflexota bacterium]